MENEGRWCVVLSAVRHRLSVLPGNIPPVIVIHDRDRSSDGGRDGEGGDGWRGAVRSRADAPSHVLVRIGGKYFKLCLRCVFAFSLSFYGLF